MSDNIEFTVSHNSKVGMWVNVIATVAAVLMGLASILKPADPANQASYDELKKAVEKNSQDIARAHDDTVALKNYLEGYMSGIGNAYPIPGPSSSAVLVPVDRSKLKGTMVVQPPSNLGPKTVVLIPTVTPPPVPSLSPPPQPAKLPDYATLTK